MGDVCDYRVSWDTYGRGVWARTALYLSKKWLGASSDETLGYGARFWLSHSS